MNYPANVPRHEPEQSPYLQPSTSSSPPIKSPTFLPPPTLPLDQLETAPDISRASSSGHGHTQGEKPAVRRSYHPNPPAHRSEWVMWTGNVPSDTNHDELWKFFNQSSVPDNPEPPGVISIFLISRTNCAFINYDSEASLDRAIARFNGQPLRPHDPRCPRLLCRVRRKDDDLKAGVGGQRGQGIHIKWIKEQKSKETERSEHSHSDLEEPGTPSSYSNTNTTPSMSVSSDDESGKPPLRQKKGSSSGSYASTNSSILSRYFPQRYFILKSLTQHDLDISVTKGVWATQKHNEGILDQAYRTSKDVFLIFGVNKSGEFFGYAKMAGPVRQGEQRVSWAQRTESSSSPPSSLSSVTGRKSDTIPEETQENKDDSPPYFSPGEHRLVDESPLPLSAGASSLPRQPFASSAPAELNNQHKKMSILTPPLKHSLDIQLKQTNFKLDDTGPIKALKNRSTSDVASDNSPVSARTTHSILQSVVEEVESPEKAVEREEGWGDTFRIDWISTNRLPFYRIRHIRNPWNHDREVKVSRDGTELEPSVGQQLIDEWEQLAEGGPAGAELAKTTAAGSKRGGPA